MESLVPEICCSLSRKSHPAHAAAPCNLITTAAATSIPAPSHSSASSSSARHPCTKPSPTASLLNADKNKNSTPPLLPLPPSRPLFPSPLKFLWFGRDNPSKAPDLINNIPLLPNTVQETQNTDDDPLATPCTCSFLDDNGEAHVSNALLHVETSAAGDLDEVCKQLAMHMQDPASVHETQVTNSESESLSDNSWISRFLRLRLLWKASDSDLSSSKQLVESALLIAAQEGDKALLSICDDCSEEVNNICIHKEGNGLSTTIGCVDGADDEEGLCMLEASEERVVHDMETMSVFLHEVPLAEVQTISKLCLLSNLAYIIPEVQSKDLLKDHHLNFVTSSLVKKQDAEAEAALERAIVYTNKKKNKVKTRQKHQPEGNAASREAPFVDVDSNHEKTAPSHENKRGSDAQRKAHTPHDLAPHGQSNVIKEIPNSEEGRTRKEAKEASLKMQSSCPCEWFICDDEASNTRYLVIQGSESLASWQANLSFDPTNFEGLLGVLVHRGVYEAAQALYDLVEKEMVEHVRKGSHARLCFTGHSLGGSLATLIAMMLVRRGVVRAGAVEGVVTLGAPCVLCAGERVLPQLNLQEKQFVNVVMHRDIVPRAFACDYPLHVARLLQRVKGSFRDHPCLNYQHALYAPVGQMMILQPDEKQSPSHPLLPAIAGLYLIRQPAAAARSQYYEDAGAEEEDNARQLAAAMEVREAQRAFLNMPHPLDVLRDPGSYGFEGAISRDHDPRSYRRAINTVLSHGLRRLRLLRKQRIMSSSRRTSTSLLAAPPFHYSKLPSQAPFLHHLHIARSSHLIHPSAHIHMGLLFILSITTQLFSSILSWA